MKPEKDTTADWFILGGAFILIMVSIASPIFLYMQGSPISTWGFHSWELYVSCLTVSMYTVLGMVFWNAKSNKSDDDEA